MNKKELKKTRQLLELKHSAGGKYLIDNTKQVAIGLIERLSREYHSLTHTELIALCASLQANLAIYSLLNDIEKNLDAITELLKATGVEIEEED